MTDRTCAEIAEHIRAHPSTARTLAPSRRQALRWAAAKRADRHELFADLTVAVQDQAELEAVRRLLERVDAEAPRHRSEEEDATARAAHIYLASGDTAGPRRSATSASREPPRCVPVTS